MHPNILSHLLEHQRFKILDALVKKLLLELDDTRHDFHDRPISLLDTANDPLRPAAFLDIRLGLWTLLLPG